MQNDLISKENLTQQSLAQIFSNAYFDITEKDGSHFIRDSYAVWLDADAKGRYIKLESVFKKSPSASFSDVLDAINTMNREYVMFRVHAINDVIVFQHYIWVEGGVPPKAIVQTYKFFSTFLSDLLAELSQKNILN